MRIKLYVKNQIVVETDIWDFILLQVLQGKYTGPLSDLELYIDGVKESRPEPDNHCPECGA